MKPVKKDPPRKPIYVGDPNDPRLKAYQAGKLVMEAASKNRARNRGKK